MQTKWLFLAGAIASEVTATLALRAASDGPAGWYALVAVGYITAFVMLSQVLRRGLAVGVVYGIWAAGGVSLTAILATVIFDESLTPVMAVGIVVVIAGVLLTEMGSHDATPKTESSTR